MEVVEAAATAAVAACGRFRIGDGRGFRDHAFHRDRHFFGGFGPGYAYYDNDCYYYGQYYRWRPYCGY
jgi:hypothetical protein